VANVVADEYTHGLSNRLTGGPANSKCLQTTEAQGLGEGWSDFFSIAINLQTSTNRDTSRPVGAWVKNNSRGVRTVPYTTNFAINKYTYSTINYIAEIHGLGTVWSTILYEVFWALVDFYGVNYARRPSFITTTMGQSIPSDGRYLAMKLVMDGMALQPCNPTFVHARDSILDADRVLTGGGNLCIMWKAFARRGLGVGVTESSTKTGIQGEPIYRDDSFDMPEACR
jgi:extracellular elastinolytic metalloproteinase